jgi:lipoate-protein ligase A
MTAGSYASVNPEVSPDPNAIFADGSAILDADIAPATWRLIVDEEPRSGPANMALDQAIAESCAAGASPSTIRFYRWNPPAVSLGRHQAVTDVDLSAIDSLGYELVRRPTGGRAILHIDELTYSVAAAADEPRVRGGVMDAYLRLSNALLSGLQQLGLGDVDKAAGDTRTGSDVSPACFEVPSAYEITSNGRKLMGSAQSRRAGYVLQHGSLPLTGDITRLIDVLALPPDEAETLRTELGKRACTLAQALNVGDDDDHVAFEYVASKIVGGFGDELQLSFDRAQPKSSEVRRAALLIREQFASPDWTNNR